MYPLTLHKSLTPEKWATYSVDKQIFMIANEISRLQSMLSSNRELQDSRDCMERAFELIDLTIECQSGNLRKELLRFRYVFAALYLMNKDELQSVKGHIEDLYRVLLSLNSKTAILL